MSCSAEFTCLGWYQSVTTHWSRDCLKGFLIPTSKYPYIWDTSKVLDYLCTLQNDRNDFATMSKKLVTLFTLLSGQRVSTLHKFKRSMMQVLPDRIIFHLSGNLKQSRPANPPEPIIFHQYVYVCLLTSKLPHQSWYKIGSLALSIFQ